MPSWKFFLQEGMFKPFDGGTVHGFDAYDPEGVLKAGESVSLRGDYLTFLRPAAQNIASK